MRRIPVSKKYRSIKSDGNIIITWLANYTAVYHPARY